MQTRTTYQRFFHAVHRTERGRRRRPLRLISLLALAFVSACAAGQQSTYKLGLSEPHMPVLCRVYLNSALTNVVDIKTTAGDCFAVTNRLQAWSMEAFVEQDGKLIPAAEYLEQARQADQPARAPAASGIQLVSVFGRFTVEGAWEGKLWEERIIPRFVDLDSGLHILPRYGFSPKGRGLRPGRATVGSAFSCIPAATSWVLRRVSKTRRGPSGSTFPSTRRTCTSVRFASNASAVSVASASTP